MIYQRLGDEGLAPGVPWTVESLQQKLIEHERLAANHGTGCICMDDYARRFEKILFGFLNAPELTPEQRAGMEARIKHVLRMLSRY